MKKVKFLAACLIMAISFIACKKNETDPSSTLEASKTSSIAKGEPILFTMKEAPTGSLVNWSVSPTTSVQINKSGNQAAIKFASKGNYTVTAVYSNVTATTSISVLDTVYNGGDNGGGTPATTLPFSSGETIKITASKYDSLGVGSGLLFSALTTNTYPCLSNSLATTNNSTASSFIINYTGVCVPSNCTTSSAIAGGFTAFYPVASGTTPLTINFNGTTYTGTIVRIDNNYTINWIHTNGVTITPTSF